MNPKHEYQASVRNDNSLGQINLLVCRAEICEHYFEFNKNLKNQKSQSKINRTDLRCDLRNDGKQTIINLLLINTEGKL